VSNKRPDDAAPEAPEPAKRSRLLRFLPLALVLIGLGLGYALGWHHYLSLDALVESREALKAMRAEHPFVAPLIFVGIYTFAVALSFPAASILSIFGGFLFGWIFGGLLVAFSATLGATLLFLAAKSAFGGVLRAKVGGRTAAFADGFHQHAFSYLLALRLAPVFPFFLVNIAPALFDVRLRTFVGATALGILPGVLAYTGVGSGLDHAIIQADAAGTSVALSDLITPGLTLAFAALALLALAPIAVKKWKASKTR